VYLPGNWTVIREAPSALESDTYLDLAFLEGAAWAAPAVASSANNGIRVSTQQAEQEKVHAFAILK